RPLPPRAPGGRNGGGGQRRARAAPARRVLARAAVLRRMAQASRALALLQALRGPDAGPAAAWRRLAGGLGALALPPAAPVPGVRTQRPAMTPVRRPLATAGSGRDGDLGRLRQAVFVGRH